MLLDSSSSHQEIKKKKKKSNAKHCNLSKKQTAWSVGSPLEHANQRLSSTPSTKMRGKRQRPANSSRTNQNMHVSLKDFKSHQIEIVLTNF